MNSEDLISALVQLPEERFVEVLRLALHERLSKPFDSEYKYSRSKFFLGIADQTYRGKSDSGEPERLGNWRKWAVGYINPVNGFHDGKYVGFPYGTTCSFCNMGLVSGGASVICPICGYSNGSGDADSRGIGHFVTEQGKEHYRAEAVNTPEQSAAPERIIEKLNALSDGHFVGVCRELFERRPPARPGLNRRNRHYFLGRATRGIIEAANAPAELWETFAEDGGEPPRDAWSQWNIGAVGYPDKAHYGDSQGYHLLCQFGYCGICDTELISNMKFAVCPVCGTKCYLT